MKKSVRRLLAQGVLWTVYRLTAAFSFLLARRGQGHWQPSGRILVIGTFHNPNWFHAHITPLTQSGIDEIILVTDAVVDPLPGVRYVCPPVWTTKLLTRAGAKFFYALVQGVRFRPDLFMGYHIFPAAISALIIARICDRPACFQVTSGPLELEGGGWHAENVVLTALGGPSLWVESAVHAVCREFDLIIVRGSKAADYIRRLGYQRRLAVITGSMEEPVVTRDFQQRSIDLIFVGRLTEYKRPDRFLRVVAKLVEKYPHLHVSMVGDGPDRAALETMAGDMQITENISFLGRRSDVPALLLDARVFVLSSRWEGLSIAMIEAMMSGVVPVVADVGDLADLADNQANGFVVEADDVDAYVARIDGLLGNESVWQAFSKNARQAAIASSSRAAVAEKWRSEFRALRTAGNEPEKNL